MAVSIWEGNKAQELINAIKNTYKVDKQQGVSNAKKVLVVGNDGNITTGYGGMSPELKEAFRNIFRHVTYNDTKGRIYFNELSAALDNEVAGGNLLGALSEFTIPTTATRVSLKNGALAYEGITTAESKGYNQVAKSTRLAYSDYENKALRLRVTGYSPDWDGVPIANTQEFQHITCSINIVSTNGTRLKWKSLNPAIALSAIPSTREESFLCIPSNFTGGTGTITADSLIEVWLNGNTTHNFYITGVELFEE